MKARASLVLTLAAVGGMAGSAAAQDEPLPVGEVIMERYIQAVGGREALSNVQTRIVKGQVEIASGGLRGEMISYVERPDRHYTRTDIDGVGVAERGRNGDVVWENAPQQDPRIVEGDEAAVLRILMQFDPLHYDRIFESIVTEAVEEVDNHTCYRVRYEPKEAAEPVYVWYDRETWLPVKTEIQYPNPNGTVKLTNYSGDYREIEGILFPFEYREVSARSETIVRIGNVQLNPEIDEHRFDLPAALREDVED